MKTTIYVLIVIMMACFNLKQVSGQWSYNGTAIYNSNTGNVGIGNAAPGTLLYVSKNLTEPTITVRNLGGFGGATYAMMDNVSGAIWKFKATLNGGFKIRDHTNSLDVIVFEPNSFANAICIKSTGNIGIGTSAPDNSALFHMSSTTKGFLPPRMNYGQMTGIANPANGLVVFNSTGDKLCMYIAAMNAWKEIAFGTIIIAPPFTCGSSLVLSHIAGAFAPVNKVVAYSTVLTNLSGSNACWITQNLGANQQATAVNDATEPSAGWYWQFNRQQGYMHDGVTRTPNTSWISSINENSGWNLVNDPCANLIGTGWRLPTSTEWFNVITNGGWIDWNGPWNSVLKMHAAGHLENITGSLTLRGSFGDYWSSTQNSSSLGWLLEFGSYAGSCNLFNFNKAYGFTVRCIEAPPPPPFTCGNTMLINHIAGAYAPVSKTVNYGTVLTNLSGSSQCWITQNLGANQQATAVSDATEQSAGWYWQFNRQQGYMHDGVTRTPNTAWISNINENMQWLVVNDPCSNELGGGWRLPTLAEWSNATANGGWTNWNGPWNSVLKMHAAGHLNLTGSLALRGSFGDYWSNTPASSSAGWLLEFGSSSCILPNFSKAYGFSVRCINGPQPAFICGNSITKIHVAGNVAPVTKTVTYGTVTNIPGEPSKCWITSNLGADQQAASVNDATEPSAGWYWQFNRMQGYKHDGTTRTPNTAWINLIDESYNWISTNDPCTIELGSGWRLPTMTEWGNVVAIGGWINWNGPWNSALKLHAAGLLYYLGGFLHSRGTLGHAWSSTEGYSTSRGYALGFDITGCVVHSYDKSTGFTLRCIQ